MSVCVGMAQRQSALGAGLPGLVRTPSWQNLSAQLLGAAIPNPDGGHPRLFASNYPRGGGKGGGYGSLKAKLIPFSCMCGKVLNGMYKCCMKSV